MESVHAVSWSARADRGVVQVTDQRPDQHFRERTASAYRRAARNDEAPEPPKRCQAPVSLELSSAAHPVEAFANFADLPSHEPVNVRLVDAVTTRTLGVLSVSDSSPGSRGSAAYGSLRFRLTALQSHR